MDMRPSEPSLPRSRPLLPPAGGADGDPPPARLLVVDDEPQIRDLLAEALRREGYRVRVAGDGRTALAEVQRGGVSVLLTDLRMPEMSGLDLIRAAKQFQPDLGSVLITAYASTETAVQALRFGADDYLTKPFRLEDLRAVVGRVLAARRLLRDERDASHRARAEAESLRQHRLRAEQDLERMRHDLKLSQGDLLRRVRDLEFVRELTALLARKGDIDRILGTTARILAHRFGAEVARLEVDLGDGVHVAEHAEPGARHEALRSLGGDLLRRAQLAADGLLVDTVLGEGRPRETLTAVVRVGERPAGGLSILRPHARPEDLESDRFVLGLVPAALSVALEAEASRRAAERAALGVAEGILEVLEHRGNLHAGHSARVARIAGRIAERMGLGPRLQRVVAMAARLHDVGEIGLPDAVLNRNGPLSDAERDVLRMHPVLGARILAPFGEAASFVRHHHERPDGLGYPDGLGADQIPVGAAIIGVAEAYDAMTSPRPYRAARSVREARAEVRRLAGTQFVREPAEALLSFPPGEPLAATPGGGLGE